MKSPLTSLINHLRDTDTKQLHTTLLLLQFGLFTSVGLTTMIIMNVIVSGDSINQRRDAITPINSSKCGDQVDVNNTTPYSAMQLNLNPLMAAFQ